MKPMDLTEIMSFMELKIMYHKQMNNTLTVRELKEILYLLECLVEDEEQKAKGE